MVIWIATGINLMKKANKGLILSLFVRIGFPWSKVRQRTNVSMLLLDFLYKMLIVVKKSMVKTMRKTTTEIDLMIARFDYIYLDLIIYILIIYRFYYIYTFQFYTILIIHTLHKIMQYMYG